MKWLKRTEAAEPPSPREVFDAAAKRHPEWLEDAAAGLLAEARERTMKTVKEAERLRAVQIVDVVLQAPERDRERFMQRAVHMEIDDVKIECFDLKKQWMRLNAAGADDGKAFGFANFAK